ncbi:MAG: hypothetical protein M0P77_08035 [Firmicutes bacterium]|nr:hypothetical protein [Bacillota bacterium]
MFLEPIFSIQQKYNKGILHKILEKSKQKERIVTKISERAVNNNFIALYIISLNRNVFDESMVSANDFKLNAVGEIINIMSSGDGDTGFQNIIINYLMQVKDKDFLIYVLDNLLNKRKYFTIKNLQVFVSTLSIEFKSSKLDNKQKKKLMDVIYRYFPQVETELQETLIRMMEILKIVDIYKTAELFKSSEHSIRKRLIDAIKGSITIKKASEIINNVNAIEYEFGIDEKYALLFIIAIEKYKLYEAINTITELKGKQLTWESILNILQELMEENLIDRSKFSSLLEMAF